MFPGRDRLARWQHLALVPKHRPQWPWLPGSVGMPEIDRTQRVDLGGGGLPAARAGMREEVEGGECLLLLG